MHAALPPGISLQVYWLYSLFWRVIVTLGVLDHVNFPRLCVVYISVLPGLQLCIKWLGWYGPATAVRASEELSRQPAENTLVVSQQRKHLSLLHYMRGR